MASSLDMSLDDLIKKNKKAPSTHNPPRGARSAGDRRHSAGAARRSSPDRSVNRFSPYAPLEKAPDSLWNHDMYDNQFVNGAANRVAGYYTERNSSMETGTKLHVSNLDFGIVNEDIKELFGEIGELKSYSINYDRSGRSKGTAEVVFAKRADAIAAVKRYNEVKLDGKEMKIEIIGSNNNIQTPFPPFPNSTFGNFHTVASKRGPGRNDRDRARTGGRNDRDRADPAKKVSVADLDAELDKYMHNKLITN